MAIGASQSSTPVRVAWQMRPTAIASGFVTLIFLALLVHPISAGFLRHRASEDDSWSTEPQESQSCMTRNASVFGAEPEVVINAYDPWDQTKCTCSVTPEEECTCTGECDNATRSTSAGSSSERASVDAGAVGSASAAASA
eukprot:CAMPEP_0115586046 /NCGR_PEP_ID=MMETSP0272-20121206/7502_1 /TAXON_ID=71861 /ORGANISM="Scrippsiella trochoidea, Strain CCMP3099" /LENGTH=140 /DNA_ID=CAMNT_0003021109 /DNA_START=56 /DNA_END=475 /DNA_ORIENTATION=+